MQQMAHYTDFKDGVSSKVLLQYWGVGAGGGWYTCTDMRLFQHFEAWLLFLSVSQELNILLTRELDDVESKLNCADWGKLQGGRTLGYRGTLGTLLAFFLSLSTCMYGSCFLYLWALFVPFCGAFSTVLVCFYGTF